MHQLFAKRTPTHQLQGKLCPATWSCNCRPRSLQLTAAVTGTPACRYCTAVGAAVPHARTHPADSSSTTTPLDVIKGTPPGFAAADAAAAPYACILASCLSELLHEWLPCAYDPICIASALQGVQQHVLICWRHKPKHKAAAFLVGPFKGTRPVVPLNAPIAAACQLVGAVPLHRILPCAGVVPASCCSCRGVLQEGPDVVEIEAVPQPLLQQLPTGAVERYAIARPCADAATPPLEPVVRRQRGLCTADHAIDSLCSLPPVSLGGLQWHSSGGPYRRSCLC